MLEYFNKENIVRETIRKQDQTRVRWARSWEWYIERLRERENAIEEYKRCSPKAAGLCEKEEEDPRTVRPFPVTTSMNYGWLAKRKEFTLEVFGPYYERYKQAPLPAEASSSIYYSTSEYGAYECGPPYK